MPHQLMSNLPTTIATVAVLQLILTLVAYATLLLLITAGLLGFPYLGCRDIRSRIRSFVLPCKFGRHVAGAATLVFAIPFLALIGAKPGIVPGIAYANGVVAVDLPAVTPAESGLPWAFWTGCLIAATTLAARLIDESYRQLLPDLSRNETAAQKRQLVV